MLNAIIFIMDGKDLSRTYRIAIVIFNYFIIAIQIKY